MKITGISVQAHDENRVNISVDGKYRFSLDISQVLDLKIKVGRECSDSDILLFEQESQFGKIYSRALEYCLMRPHSLKEVRDYLYRKTLATLDKNGQRKAGASTEITNRVLDKLIEKGYVDDKKFTHFWLENRSLSKGASRRKLIAELRSKGVSSSVIENELSETIRDDDSEIEKIIKKKRSRYPDDKKFMTYLLRLGFDYDDIKQALTKTDL